MKSKEENAITLVALIVTIIILLVLAGIAIATLGEENGLFARVKQAKKAHMQSEMQEQLTLALNSLQIDKNGSASLDDVTQEWISSVISSDYNPTIKEDASLNGKLVIMNKSNITGKFLIGQNLEISSSEYNLSSLEFEYETEKIENGKVKILIKITDKINGLKQVDYPGPKENTLVMENRKTPLGIDYYVELGKEYKFLITTGDGNKTEKIINIDDYYYNVTKTLAENAVIDNNATKTAYNKTYEATVSTEGNYVITGLTVTMGGQAVTTAGNNVVDVNTGKIKIEKVTGDINIIVMCNKNNLLYDNGNKCEKITGGWKLNRDYNSKSDIDSYNYILLKSVEVSNRGSALSTNNAIDLTKYAKIKMLIDKKNTGSYHYFRFGIKKTPIIGVAFDAF